MPRVKILRRVREPRIEARGRISGPEKQKLVVPLDVAHGNDFGTVSAPTPTNLRSSDGVQICQGKRISKTVVGAVVDLGMSRGGGGRANEDSRRFSDFSLP